MAGRYSDTVGIFREDDQTWLLVFDTILTESESRSANVTQHPVESGIQPVDHIEIQPLQLTMTVIWTTAYKVFQTEDVIENEGIYDPSEDRDLLLYNKLIEIFESRTSLTIIGVSRRYQNMVLESIQKNTNNTKATEVSLSFKEVKIVELLNVKIPPSLRRRRRTNQEDSTLTQETILMSLAPPELAANERIFYTHDEWGEWTHTLPLVVLSHYHATSSRTTMARGWIFSTWSGHAYPSQQ